MVRVIFIVDLVGKSAILYLQEVIAEGLRGGMSSLMLKTYKVKSIARKSKEES